MQKLKQYCNLPVGKVHPSWQPWVQKGLAVMDVNYLRHLQDTSDWLPQPKNIFNAFSLPLKEVRYVLFGESPYPRAASANGYAFWDAAVHALWSSAGLSKPVNRATSLRNLMKMMLIAEGKLDPRHATQTAIAAIDKSSFIQSNDELFDNFLQHGFLLLNATLVLQPTMPPAQTARYWLPFMQIIMQALATSSQAVRFLLFGRIAHLLMPRLPEPLSLPPLVAEHPYNISFITNKKVLDFFRPLHLLHK